MQRRAGPIHLRPVAPGRRRRVFRQGQAAEQEAGERRYQPAQGGGGGMTTAEVLSIVKARGLRVEIKEGRPILCGKKEELTPALLAVLKRHREKILAAHGVETAPRGAQAVQDTGRSVEVRFSTGLIER